MANNKKKISARKKILESDNDNDDDDEGEKTEDSQGAGSAGPAAGQDVEMDTASPVAGPSGIRRSQVNIYFRLFSNAGDRIGTSRRLMK